MTLRNDTHRYQAVERMLRRGVGAARVPAGTAACVDGETMAAWSSGALEQWEAAQVEEHVADCERCQSILVALAQTGPVTLNAPAIADTPVAPSVSAGRRVQLRWLVPLATAATIAAIWVAIPQRNEPAPSIAESQAPIAAAPPSEQQLRLQDQAAAAPTTPSAAPAPAPEAAAPPAVSAPAARGVVAPPASAAPVPPPAREAEGARERKEEMTLARRDSRNPATGAAAGAVAAPQSAPAPAPPPAPAPAPALVAPNAADTLAAAPEGRQSMMKVASAEFASPDGNTRWRVVNGQIERSRTRGKNWEPVGLPMPVNEGHAPSELVAWFVGNNGTVYLTTNGATFQRVPFPHPLTLVGVLAIDDRQATVIADDGQVFGTSNRGQTWIQP